MSSNMVTLGVNEVVSEWTTVLKNLDKQHTYVTIFGLNQKTLINKFKELYKDKINILFEDRAVNSSPQHANDTSLRQHIFVYEAK